MMQMHKLMQVTERFDKEADARQALDALSWQPTTRSAASGVRWLAPSNATHGEPPPCDSPVVCGWATTP